MAGDALLACFPRSAHYFTLHPASSTTASNTNNSSSIMRIPSLAVLFIGLVDATSINGENIQQHMNKVDKLRLMEKSRQVRVSKGRKLDQTAYGDGTQSSGNYDYSNYGSDQSNNGDREYYTQSVSQYYNNGDQEEEQGDFQIDGSYSIKFEQCVSLKTLNSEMINNVDGGLDMQAGVDFVMFKATDKYGKETEFAVDIASFVESLVQTIPNDREQYCQVCEQAFDTCQEQKELAEWNAVVANTGNMGNYYSYNAKNGYEGMQDWGMADEDYSNRRKMEDAQQYSNGQYNGQNSEYSTQEVEDEPEYIDCDTCDSYGCFDDLYRQQKASSSYQGDDQQDDLYAQQGYYESKYNSDQEYYAQEADDDTEISMQAALNWLTELGQCKKLNVFMNNNANYAQYQNSGQNTYYQNEMTNPYASLMCNTDGSGMEIGIFHDDECTVYDSTRTFKGMLKSGSPQESYYEMTRGLIEFSFTQSIDCKQMEYAEPDWDARYDYDYQAATEDANANEQNYEAYSQSKSEYYQDQTDAYYSYYQEGGTGEEAIDSCQQLFSAEYLQLNIACNAQQAQQNYQNVQFNMSAPYQPYRYQSYYYDLTDATDMDQVCTAMKLKRDNGGFDTMMSQSRFANMYNYKLYSAKATWNDYTTKISEGVQSFKHHTGEKFRSMSSGISGSTIAILVFLIAASILLVAGIFKMSGKFAERLVHSEEQEESRTEHLVKEIESYEFFDEAENDPSGKRLRVDYPPTYNFA